MLPSIYARKAAGFKEITKGKFMDDEADLIRLCKFIQGVRPLDSLSRTVRAA